MSPAALLPRLSAAGIVATREGSRVRLRGRQPPPDLLAELQARKAELLAELAEADTAEDWCPDIRDARLAPIGSPERHRLDRDHATLCSGLLSGFRRHAGGGR